METELGKSKILLQKMLIKKVNYLKKILIISFLILPINNSKAEFFTNLPDIDDEIQIVTYVAAEGDISTDLLSITVTGLSENNPAIPILIAIL